MKRSGFIFGILYLCTFFAVISLAACDGGGSSDSEGGGALTKAAELNQKSVSDAAKWMDDNVSGCELVQASQASASAARLKSVSRSNRSIFQIFADVLARHVPGDAAALQYLPPLDPVAGDCGGTVSITEDHANGDSVITLTFENFCVQEGGEATIVDGTLVVNVQGEPGDMGADLISISASTQGELTVVAGDETLSMSLDNFRYRAGNPGAAPTAVNPDVIVIDGARIELESQEETHTLDDVEADIYSDGDNTVLDVHAGTYTAGEEGYVKTTTPEPVVINPNGVLVSGVIQFEGAEGNTVSVVPDGSGIFEITFNGEPLDDRVDCSDIEIDPITY